jgi:ribosomal protein S18 acetylase RimI-like enzyme
MTYQLIFENNPLPEDIQILGDAIMKQATEKKGFNPLDFFAFFIRDKQNTIVGGCNGNTLYGCLYIDQVWVGEALRNQGFGTQLMDAAVQYGKDKECTFAAVNTMDWEALGFYHKLGFTVEFERHGLLNDSVFYFLRKELSEATTSIQEEAMKIRPFLSDDIELIVDHFAKHGWHKPTSTFETYWREQTNNERLIWLAFYKQQFAGYITLKWNSPYSPFKKYNIPEIMDLNVLPPYRGKGIGFALLKTAEREAGKQHDVVGLGVGLYRDYGSAQKLYVRNGYMPDGLGVTYQYQTVEPGANVCLDDDLVLWFTKKLK